MFMEWDLNLVPSLLAVSSELGDSGYESVPRKPVVSIQVVSTCSAEVPNPDSQLSEKIVHFAAQNNGTYFITVVYFVSHTELKNFSYNLKKVMEIDFLEIIK